MLSNDLLGCVSAEHWAIEFSGENFQAESLARTFAAVTGLSYRGRIGQLNAFEFSFPEDAQLRVKEFVSGTRSMLKAISASSPFSVGPTHVLDDMARLYSFAENHMATRRFSAASIAAKAFANRFGIAWAEEQVIKSFEKRNSAALIQNPLFPQQYHLSRLTADTATLNVTGAWDTGLTGSGVVVAIVDDGLQYVHPDIQANYRPEGSYNFDFNHTDPAPTSMTADYHGTSSAGVAAARDDGATCGVGVAYRAGLSGIAILQTSDLYDAKEANALQYALTVNHIYSNSWGPPDDGREYRGPGPLANQAIDLGIRTGRNGLGAIYVWAAGNGGSNDNCNYDGYASKRQVVTVGAVDSYGVKSIFSEECSALLIVAPSASNSRSFIRTTDLLGTAGRNAGDCNVAFSGTSAACPAVAGVVALILEENPALTWLDVQRILIYSAYRTDPTSPSWVQNGAGRWASHSYGFGLADAYTAVQLAKEYKYGSNASMTEEIVLNYWNSDLVSFSPQWDYNFDMGAAFNINVTEDIILHHVEVVIDSIQTPDAGKLAITLTSPSGFVSTFAKPHYQNPANLEKWTFTSRLLWGESSVGIWRFVILDPAASNIHSFSLRIWGTPTADVPNSVYKRKAGDDYWPLDSPVHAPTFLPPFTTPVDPPYNHSTPYNSSEPVPYWDQPSNDTEPFPYWNEPSNSTDQPSNSPLPDENPVSPVSPPTIAPVSSPYTPVVPVVPMIPNAPVAPPATILPPGTIVISCPLPAPAPNVVCVHGIWMLIPECENPPPGFICIDGIWVMLPGTLTPPPSSSAKPSTNSPPASSFPNISVLSPSDKDAVPSSAGSVSPQLVAIFMAFLVFLLL